MGFQKDQTYDGPTFRPESTPKAALQPPPLPPRLSTGLSNPQLPPPPSYETAVSADDAHPLTHMWSGQDPRTSSTQSLVPSYSERNGKRKLLLIYIHGFLGNETSFQSFPAHVHNRVTTLLAESHVVHTKLYPKYKSRKAIEYARDDFSNWLCPHEAPDTDVILLGHSLGGILAAEVALLTPYSSASPDRFRHRIIGTINFDTPFLGMHPGVISSGIGSLFRPAPESPSQKVQSASTSQNDLLPTSSVGSQTHSSSAPASYLFPTESPSPAASGQGESSAWSGPTSPGSPYAQDAVLPLSSSVHDPNYDPPFPNDVRIPTRKGWDNALHFIMKHSDGLTKATKSYVTSHLEFGGCLADYNGLKSRYSRLRQLEDVDELQQEQIESQRPLRKVRFVNYYTASTGRPKPIKPTSPQTEKERLSQENGSAAPAEQEMQDMSHSDQKKQPSSDSPRILAQEPKNREIIPISVEDADETDSKVPSGLSMHEDDTSRSSQELNHMDPRPLTDDEDQELDDVGREIVSPPLRDATSQPSPSSPGTATAEKEDPSITPSQTSLSLPPVPPSPSEPEPFDPSSYSDKDIRKLAEKEHSRQVKAFQRAVKDREKIIKDRRKLVEKQEKNARKAREKQAKLEEKLKAQEEKEEMKRKATLNPEGTAPPFNNATGADQSRDQLKRKAEAAEKPKRDRKFCMLPPKDADGKRDPCWVRVFMKDVDEVGAHCGLFFAYNPHYEALVGDVSLKVEEWIGTAASVRMIKELEGQGDE